MRNASSRSSSTNAPVRAFWILATVFFLVLSAIGATMPFFALYARSLGASISELALVVGVNATTSLVAGLFWGRMADRVRRRRPFIIISMAALAIINVAISRVPTWEWLIPLHILLGVANGANAVTSLALMGDILHEHRHRSRFLSGYRMSGSLAFAIAVVLSGWLSENVNIRDSFLIAAACYAVAFVLALAIREPPPITSAARPTGFVALLSGPMRPLLIVALSYGVPFTAVFSVWPIWVSDELGLGRAMFAQLWGIAAFIEVPSLFVAGILMDRIGKRPLFMTGLIGFTGIYIAYVLFPNLSSLIAIQIVRGVVLASYAATSITMAVELAPPHARGRAAGLFTSAEGLSQILGNWLGPPVAAAAGFTGLFEIAAVVAAIGAAYSFIVLGRLRSNQTAAPTQNGAADAH